MSSLFSLAPKKSRSRKKQKQKKNPKKRKSKKKKKNKKTTEIRNIQLYPISLFFICNYSR